MANIVNAILSNGNSTNQKAVTAFSMHNFNRGLCAEYAASAPSSVIAKSPLPATQSKYAANSLGAVCSAGVLNALVLYERGGTDTETIGVGLTEDGSTIAEYRHEDGSIDAAKYEPATGNIYCCRITETPPANGSNKTQRLYTKFDIMKRDGAVLALALMPTLMGDDEFADDYKAIADALEDASQADAEFFNKVARMSSNLEARANAAANNNFVAIQAHSDFKLLDVLSNVLSGQEIESTEPETVVSGKFTVFSAEKKFTVNKPVDTVSANGMFAYGTQTQFTKEIVKLDNKIKLNDVHLALAKVIKDSTKMLRPIRTVLLSGSAGSGKSEASRILAGLLARPRGHYVCHAETSVYDLLGTYAPNTDESDKLTPEEKEVAESLKAEINGGATINGIPASLTTDYSGEVNAAERKMDELMETISNMPTIDDFTYDPESSYERIVGTPVPSGTVLDGTYLFGLAMGLLQDKVEEAKASLQRSKNNLFAGTERQKVFDKAFKFVPSEVVEGLVNGWVVEIAEATKIVNAGTLSSLNDFVLGDDIKLPTGERVKRHPDSVLVFTTNVSYAGDRQLEQSVISRCDLSIQLDTPTIDELVARAMVATGCTDAILVRDLAEKVLKVADYCDINTITDGVAGFRELCNWITLSMLGLSSDKFAADWAVINKSTFGREDRESIRTSVLGLTESTTINV